MEINKNNYEAFFLDYHEGNLSPQQVADVLLFVQNHPELKEELESFENFSIQDYSTITFENKAGLKKEITEANQEEYFIKAVENTLSPAEKKLLDNYIKQHPHVIVDYHLFQQTKLQANANIVFENKDKMKKVLTPQHFSALAEERSEALISLVEGVLSEEEEGLFKKQIAGDVELQKEVALYMQTKLLADTTIVFENKNDLKRKERKVIPLYYYMAAAAILLLFGLFFMFNNNKGEQFATNSLPNFKNQSTIKVQPSSSDKTNTKEIKDNNIIVPELATLAVKKSLPQQLPTKKNKAKQLTNQDITSISEINIMESTYNLNEPTNEMDISVPKKENPVADNQSPITSQPTLNNEEEFLSLTEMAVKKFKENTLDEKTLAAEKKSGRLKKLSGWDLAKAVAKGVSKLTGRDVKVEPKYNDNGDVTAYALGAGSFEITRAR